MAGPARRSARSSTRIAWKTGTSFGFRDAWALGVTDRYTIGVWMGRPDGTPNPGHFGANSAAPLLKDLAAALPEFGPQQLAPRHIPASVKPHAICWPLGRAESLTAAGALPATPHGLDARRRRPADLARPPGQRRRLETAWVAQGSACGPIA